MNAEPTSPVAPAIAEHDALPAGTRFGELEIVRVLGVGGFGIVYLARDHALERHVALKEYMPASLAQRGVGPLITVRSGAHAQTYAAGLRSFINEARLLARFDHPSLVKVYRFWEDNATAYMVMPYLQGRTLRDVRRSVSQAPSEMWIRHLLGSLLSAMELLHSEGVYHRDIAPDNILLAPEGPPILLDFGAARRVISDRTQTLTAILKPNYAPIEQYAEMTQLRQGPWTDIYALGAVAHFLLFGAPPPPATARVVHDTLWNLPQRLVEGISPRLFGTVAWMLAVRPQHRPQNVQALRDVLDGRAPVPAVPSEPELPAGDMTLPLAGGAEFPPTLKVDSYRTGPTRFEPGLDETVIRPVAARMPPQSVPMPAESAARAGSGRMRWVAWVGVTCVVAAAAAAWLWPGSRPPASTVPVAGIAGLTISAPALAASSPPAVAMLPAPAADPVPPARVDAVPVPEQDRMAADKAAQARAVADALLAQAASLPKEAARSPARAPTAQRTASLRGDAAAAPTGATEPASVPEAPPQSTPGNIAGAGAGANNGTSAVPTVAAEPDGPPTARQACGKRVFIALWSCMDRECERPRYRDQPECVKVLETKRSRGQ